MIQSPSTPSFGERVKRQRHLLDLTQAELAKRAGCARVTIHKIESDDLHPSKQLAELLAHALEIPTSEHETFVRLARGMQGAEEAKSPEVSTANGSLYRRIFIGREVELKQAQAAFDTALAGKGSLLMVVGEPGIGKTALCERLAAYANRHGGRTLVGHCFEEGSPSIPYLPFMEAIRAYALTREPSSLRRELGMGASDVARIVPEVRERLGLDVHAHGNAASLASADDLYRLLEAVSNFLRAAAESQPLLIVLEDLHWADRGTLYMLLYMARQLAGSRMLVAGTYRDVEVDRSHPLSSALADLRRAGAFGRILLRGFGTDDVQRMLTGIVGQEVSPALAEAVHRQTEGNPLFIEEVVRYLSEAGLITHDEQTGRWQVAAPAPLPTQIPEGLREVIGKRLSRLSPTCNRVLAVAAVIGRDFALDVLQRVVSLPEEDVLNALEEAHGAAIVEERLSRGAGVAFRFTHALFRQTLYEETFTPRRIRLHQQVGRALETQYGGRLTEHAAEMAEHFAQSSDPADLAKVVEYGTLAAQRAMDVYAYSEVARILEQALWAQDAFDPDDKAKRCDLLLSLGEALIPAGEPQRVVDTIAVEAFSLAQIIQDDAQCSRTCLLAMRGIRAYGASWGMQTRVFREWAERADHYAKAGTPDRVYADGALAELYMQQGRLADEWKTRLHALKQARQLSALGPFFFAAMSIVGLPRAAQHRELQLDLVEELTSGSHAAVTMHWGYLLRVCGLVYLSDGERERAEALWHRLAELAYRSPDVYVKLMPFTSEIWLATLDGNLEAAAELGARLVARADELGSPLLGRQFATTATSRALIHLGRVEEVLAAFTQHRQQVGVAAPAHQYLGFSCLLLAMRGQRIEAMQQLSQALEGLRRGLDADEISTMQLVNLLEAALILEHRESVALLVDRLSDLVAYIDGWAFTCVGRHLAAAAALLGDRQKAAAYNQQALAVATKVRFRPEVALIRLQMAESLHRDSNESARVEAQAHLNFAIAEFRAMKMQPSLERALKVKAEA